MDKKNKKKYIFISILSFSLIALIAVSSIYVHNRNQFRQSLKHNNKEYPITGIDISSHNSKVDFQKVTNDSISFVYLKATEGVSFKDPNFEKNYEGAINNNIPVGAYHFFRFDMNGTLQAKHFLKNISNKLFDLPIAIDVEDASNPTTDIDIVIKRLKDFIDYIDADKNKILIYTNLNGYNKYIRNNFDNCLLWICRFSKPSSEIKWQIWQYSHWGEVDGISGEVDLDVFNGNKDDFQNFIGEFSY